MSLSAEAKALVEETIRKYQEDTLKAASTVAEEIAKKFLDKHEQKVDKISEETQAMKSSSLKGRGNRKQMDFCTKMQDTLDKVEECIVEKDAAKAKTLLEEGKKDILKRMKLIKLADREDWIAANEYDTDDLADNSEDEKAINRAVRSANAKKEKARKFKLKKSYKGRDDRRRSYAAPAQSPYNVYPNFHNQAQSGSYPRICWYCQRQGHFASQCPNKFQNLQVPNINNDRTFK